METGVICCPIMDQFLGNANCKPKFREGYIHGCDDSFRYAEEDPEEDTYFLTDDPDKRVRFCPWCGSPGSWDGDQWLPS